MAFCQGTKMTPFSGPAYNKPLHTVCLKRLPLKYKWEDSNHFKGQTEYPINRIANIAKNYQSTSGDIFWTL